MRAIPDLELTETRRSESQSPNPPLAPDQPSLPQTLPDPKMPLNSPLLDEMDVPQPTEASLPGKKLWKLIDALNCWKLWKNMCSVLFGFSLGLVS